MHMFLTVGAKSTAMTSGPLCSRRPSTAATLWLFVQQAVDCALSCSSSAPPDQVQSCSERSSVASPTRAPSFAARVSPARRRGAHCPSTSLTQYAYSIQQHCSAYCLLLTAYYSILCFPSHTQNNQRIY